MDTPIVDIDYSKSPEDAAEDFVNFIFKGSDKEEKDFFVAFARTCAKETVKRREHV